MASSTLSYEGQQNKWNTADDAAGIVADILAFPHLETLILENNTLGPQAAKVIGEALAKHPEFKNAIWKDLFTGRLKTEIPQALKYLFAGIVKAGAQLRELDLSDNALGPVGVEGMVDFVETSACYKLEVLRLNNNGLGITGGKRLAKSLGTLFANSRINEQPWQLKTFIAGRNRLETEGAGVYASLFAQLESLQEVAMPQNGITAGGVAALARALGQNPGLRVLNLNDNTFTVKGAEAMAAELSKMPRLEVINFGDCLLRTRGAVLIARALWQGHTNLRELHLDGNEMGVDGGTSVAEAVINKSRLELLNLDCNCFGEEGVSTIKDMLDTNNRLGALGSLEGDEEPDSGGEEEESEDGSSSSSSSSSSDEETDTEDDLVVVDVVEASAPAVEPSHDTIPAPVTPLPCTPAQYLASPSPGGLLGLPCVSLLPAAVQAPSAHTRVSSLASVLAQAMAYLDTADSALLAAAEEACVCVAHELFTLARKDSLVSYASNCLLAACGLIKSEEKRLSEARHSPKGLLEGLKVIAEKGSFPKQARPTIAFFVERKHPRFEAYTKEKEALLAALRQT